MLRDHGCTEATSEHPSSPEKALAVVVEIATVDRDIPVGSVASSWAGELRNKMNMTICQEDSAQEFLATWNRTAGPLNDRAEKYLCASDPRLGEVIEAVGPQRFGPSPAKTHFDAIARSIVFQQLSTNAAASIYGRYRRLLGKDPGPFQVLAAKPEALRSAGLSAPKIRYLKAIAAVVASGELALERIDDLPDQTIVDELTRVVGIGTWTAQMFLMFRLGRLDVLPTQDIGIQRGLQLVHRLRKPAAPSYITRAGKKWAPYRSIACLYLWAAVDTGFAM